jgi:hypothetical protein
MDRYPTTRPLWSTDTTRYLRFLNGRIYLGLFLGYKITVDNKLLMGTLIVVIAGFGGVLPTVHMIEHNVAVQNNQATDATIVGTSIQQNTGAGNEERYSPVITYEYEVNGQTYRNDNTFPGAFQRWNSEGYAEHIAYQYRDREKTEVYYNPAKPSNAYVINDGKPGNWYFGALFTALVAGIGGWAIVSGFRRWRQRALMKDMPTSEVQSLAIGPTEIKGTVKLEDREPLTAPFSETDCVIGKYKIKEYHRSKGDGTWSTIADGAIHTPFYVDDGTGSVLVTPHDETNYELHPGGWRGAYVPSDKRGDEPIQRFVRGHPSIGFPSNKMGKFNDRKYRQNLITEGDDIYIFGTVHPREESDGYGGSNENRLVIRKADGDGSLSEPMFMISDNREEQLVENRKYALWRLPTGGVLLVIAFCMAIGIFAQQLGVPLPASF